jgi:DUF1680 family protein
MFQIILLQVASHKHPHFSTLLADDASASLSNGSAPLSKVEPFSLAEARLTSGTSQYAAQQLNLEYLLSLPVLSLAYNFRNTSHLSLGDAVPFGGWETPYGPNGDDRGHFTGHYLSASALAVVATDNKALRANAEQLVVNLGECQDANANIFPKFGPGYLSGFPTLYFDCLENLWRKPCRYMQVPYYNVHKTMQGLVDQHMLLGNEQALHIVKQMAAYFYRRISNVLAVNGTQVWASILDTESGGMNDVMYQLYRLTGEADHLAMAHLFDKSSWFGPLVNGTDILPGKNATNRHLPPPGQQLTPAPPPPQHLSTRAEN